MTIVERSSDSPASVATLQIFALYIGTASIQEILLSCEANWQHKKHYIRPDHKVYNMMTIL